MTAEYLIGYDDITGNAVALVFGVFFFAPLYGAPAVLIREVTRRRGLGWPTILLLATAFGLIEAGLVDQSLFDPAYRDISYWDDLRDPTFLPWCGTSAYMLLTFVGGHVLGSIAAPIAMAETWWPDRARGPWLGPFGLVVTGLSWLAGSAFILVDQLSSTSFRISPAELWGTVAVVLALVALALTRRRPHPDQPGAVPAPWVVGVVSAVLLTVRSVVGTNWAWTLTAVAATVVWLVLMGRWSARAGWDGRHLVAALVGDLLSIGGPAFVATPLGDVPLAAKLTSNVLLLALVLGLAARGYRSADAGGRRPPSAQPAAVAAVERLVPVVAEGLDALVARGDVERHRLGLGGARLQDHHVRSRGPGRGLEVGEHQPGQALAPTGRRDVHPLHLGRTSSTPAGSRRRGTARHPSSPAGRRGSRRRRRPRAGGARRPPSACGRARRSARRTPAGRPRRAAARRDG